jgi:hypothetical protein
MATLRSMEDRCVPNSHPPIMSLIGCHIRWQAHFLHWYTWLAIPARSLQLGGVEMWCGRKDCEPHETYRTSP